MRTAGEATLVVVFRQIVNIRQVFLGNINGIARSYELHYLRKTPLFVGIGENISPACTQIHDVHENDCGKHESSS